MKVKAAVMGMGYWGKNLVRNFYELGALSAVCDYDESREKVISEKYPSVAFTTEFDDILNDDSINAVIIATPAVSHFELAKRALSTEKDVFVEKPLSLNVEQGRELIAIAERHRRILMVGHILHYHPAVVKLKKLIRDGELGEIRYLYSNRLNIGKIRTEENILWSFAPHDISVILGLLDEEPSVISCEGSSFIGKGVVDVTLSQFRFPSGIRAHVFVSWLHPFKEQLLVIVGSEKMAVFDDTSSEKLKLYNHKVELTNGVPSAIKGDAEIIELPDSEPLRNECEHFIDCVVNRKEPLTNGSEGLKVLQILDRCQKELDENSKEI